jgi:sec-independent protein translocase protein TatA
MFVSHMPELIGVLVIGLVIFGPKRLPEIGSSLGQGIRELKKGVSEITEPTPRPQPPED